MRWFAALSPPTDERTQFVVLIASCLEVSSARGDPATMDRSENYRHGAPQVRRVCRTRAAQRRVA